MTTRARSTKAAVATNGATRPITYPESDGKPIAETELHLREMFRLIMTLDGYFADRADVHVAGNQLLYYEEGNPRRSVAPDVYVTVGIPKLPLLRTYQVWREGQPPTFIIEVSSLKTRREDLGRKRDLYAQLGVSEYILYDPLAEYLRPPLQGNELAGGVYLPMQMEHDGSLLSKALGLCLQLENGRLRFIERHTDLPLLSPVELATQEAARATQEAARAEHEAIRANDEATRADSAEARVRELEALLADRSGSERRLDTT